MASQPFWPALGPGKISLETEAKVAKSILMIFCLPFNLLYVLY
jgi:hypothetical protein